MYGTSPPFPPPPHCLALEKTKNTPTQSQPTPHLRPQHLRWGTGWVPWAWGCPGPRCKAFAGPTTSGSSRWPSRWWAVARSPGWGWAATPGCTGCGEGPRSEAPAWQRPPPRRSKIPFQTWPCREGWGGPESAWGAPRPRKWRSRHCPCSPVWSQCGLSSTGPRKRWGVCQAPGPGRPGAAQTGPLREASWMREGKEGCKERGRRRGRIKKKEKRGDLGKVKGTGWWCLSESARWWIKTGQMPRSSHWCWAEANPPLYCIAEQWVHTALLYMGRSALSSERSRVEVNEEEKERGGEREVGVFSRILEFSCLGSTIVKARGSSRVCVTCVWWEPCGCLFERVIDSANSNDYTVVVICFID